MCLMICSKILSYFPISTNDLNPKPNSVLPILSIQRHRVSLVISHCQTLANRLYRYGSRSHRDGIAISLFPFCNFSVSPKEQIGPTEIAMQTLCFPFVTFRSHRKSKSVPPSLPDQLSG